MNRDSIPSTDVDTLADESIVDPAIAKELVPTLVRASAGTGKTYKLTGRLMRILFQGAPVETVLATTFTRKAAGEILDRVLSSLARAADAENPKALEQLREQVEIESLSRVACLQLTQKLLRNVHRFRICTLDSLFSQLARSFPFELGLPPAWRLTDEIEESWMREIAAESMISSLEPGEMTSLLSMLGKGELRRSINREVLRVVQNGYTVQRQSGNDAWEKIGVPKAPKPDDLTRISGHMRSSKPSQASLQKKLQSVADAIDIRQLKQLIHDTLLINIAKARQTGEVVKFGRSKFPEGELDEAFDTLYAAVRTEALSLLDAQNRATGKVLSTYDHHVTTLKQSSRALGFDDVAVRLANQFADFDSRSLSGRMDGSIDHLLLDEFQDTSPIQWQVLRPLAVRCARPNEEVTDELAQSRTHSFFCVGDTKQAIYGWRGGVAEIFGAVADQIDRVATYEQNTSFRSSPVVIDVVNRVFRNLTRHPMTDVKDPKDRSDNTVYAAEALRQFSAEFPEHQANQETLPGYVSFQTSRSDDGNAESKRNVCFRDAAAHIAKLNANAPELSIGVLTRSNSGVAQMYFELDRLGVDVSQEGGNPLTDSAAVEVILSALMWAEHPGDLRWEFHVQSTPLKECIPKKGSDFIRRMAEDRGLTETIEFLADGLAGACDARDTIRLQQLAHMAMLYQPNAAPRLRDFVRMVREKRVERPQIAPVRVMTIHQAKGLEFDAVYLPQLDGDLVQVKDAYVVDVPKLGDPPVAISRWMSNKSWHFLSNRWQQLFGEKVRAANTEALCTLYVAMTRAKKALYAFIPPARKSEFANKNAGSLLYHSLQCDDDPTEPEKLLFETGDKEWFTKSDTSVNASERPKRASAAIEIQFQPLPPVPRRNRD